MTQLPPARNITCRPIAQKVPVPVLVWHEYAEGHYSAEPLPGYVFYMIDLTDSGEGWLFQIPGKPAAPCTTREIAAHACEYHWFCAIKKMLNGGFCDQTE